MRDFWEKHADSEKQLQAWYNEAEQATWKSPNDIKKDYPSASILEDNIMVFNIRGNNYRLIVRINYKYGVVWIRFIGTHAEYDKVDATKI
nr:type II toxin-antitoxin system HigB family toxin [Rufibacter sp. XAAS-G3-1]